MDEMAALEAEAATIENGESVGEEIAENLQSLTVMCPDECGPGSVILISTDWGTELEVEVPDGVHAGDEFVVTVEMPQQSADTEAEAGGDELQALSIECPAGCGPGDTIAVSTEDGRDLEVVIPDSIEAGMIFEVIV